MVSAREFSPALEHCLPTQCDSHGWIINVYIVGIILADFIVNLHEGILRFVNTMLRLFTIEWVPLLDVREEVLI